MKRARYLPPVPLPSGRGCLAGTSPPAPGGDVSRWPALEEAVTVGPPSLQGGGRGVGPWGVYSPPRQPAAPPTTACSVRAARTGTATNRRRTAPRRGDRRRPARDRRGARPTPTR